MSGPPRRVIIGLDVGTTATKAVAFGIGAEWRHVSVCEYPLLQPAPGQQVQDCAVVLEAVRAALRETVDAAAGAEVAGVSLSAAMHGLIALDGDARPLTPLLTWADARATEQARALRADPRAAALARRTGTPVHSMTPLTKLIWFAEHDPDTFAAARHWVGLKELVVHALTGELATELSSASATGLLNLDTRDWDDEALALAGIGRDKLAELRSPTDVVAGVVLGGADGPLANVGAGALAPGVVGLSLGTSGAVRMVLGEPRADRDPALFCYALTEDRWVVGGAVSNGGIVVRWAGRALAPDLAGDDAVLALAAEAPPGSDGLAMLPYLLAERAPLWDPDVAGAYLGVRRRHTRAHFARAAIEGVCRQLALIVELLERLEPVTEVHVTGGALRAPLWREILAATLDRPLSAVAEAEGSALGAAALGLVALGEADSLEAALALLPGPQPPDPVVPDPELARAYREARAAIPGLVGRLMAAAEQFAALN